MPDPNAQPQAQPAVGFDLDAARKAGYKDPDILNRLASAHNFDLDGARKAGYKDDDILNRLAAMPAPAPPSQTQGSHADFTASISKGGEPQPENGKGLLPGMSDEDIIKHYGYDPAEIQKSHLYSKGDFSGYISNPNRHDVFAKIADSPVGDMGYGLLGTANGVGQLITHALHKAGVASDADTKYMDLMTKLAHDDYVENVRHGHPGMIGQMIGQMVLPMPGGEGVGTSVWSRLGRGALGGAEAAAAQPVDVQPDEDYSSAKESQAIGGAMAGAATTGVMSAIGHGVGRMVDAFRGSMSPAAQEIEDQAAKHGVEHLSYGDVTGNPNAQKAEVLGEKIPFAGFSSFRKAQQDEVKTAAENLSQKYNTAMQNQPYDNLAAVRQAANNGDKTARQTVELIQNAGSDPDRIRQASIALNNWRTRQIASSMYNRVQQLAGHDQVPVSNTLKALNDAIDQEMQAKSPDKGLISYLQELRSNISPKTTTSTGVGPNWQKVTTTTTTPANNTFELLRKMRSDIGDVVSDMHTPDTNALIGKKGSPVVQSIRDAVENDLNNYALKSNNPQLKQAWQVADQYYRNVRRPFKDAMVANAGSFQNTEPDQIFDKFIQAYKGDRAQKFYNALDNKGRASVRYQIMADAMNQATNNTSGAFSPQKFVNALDKIKDAYGVFFQGPEKAEMDGFRNLMAHVTRAGQFAENPPTGNRWVDLTLGGLPITSAFTALVSPHAAAVEAAPIPLGIAARFMMTTPTGRRLLLQAANTRVGSRAMGNIVARISTAVGRAAGQATQMYDQPSEPVQPVIRLRAPNGQEQDVPVKDARHLMDLGAVPVQ